MHNLRTPILSIILQLSLASQTTAQVPIQDNPNYGQLERMSATRWDNWQPDPNTDWLGIPDDFEGWFYWRVLHHGYYTGPDLRPLKTDGPYTENIASIGVQQTQDQAHSDDMDSINNSQLTEFANMSGGSLDVLYSIYYSGVFSDLDNQHTLLLAGLNPTTLQFLNTNNIETRYQEKAAVIKERVSAVHNAYMQRGSRMLAYIRLEKEWTAMLQAYAMTVKQATAYLSHKK
jgi:hypothetical protein